MSNLFSFKNITIGVISFWLFFFVLLPSTMVLVTSFLTRGQTDFIEPVLTVDNYRALLDPVYFKIFTRTLKYSALTTLICLVSGYPFAWIISRFSSGKRVLLLIMVIIPFWTSSLIRTYAMVIILRGNGIVNSILLWAGMIDEPLQILYTDAAVYLGLVYALLPFMILPLYGSLEKIDLGLIEAAKDLGAGTIDIFGKIIIPLSMPGVIAGCIMVFLPSMGLFYITDLLGGAKSMLLGNFIKNQFLTSLNWPLGSAATVFMTLAMLAMIFIHNLDYRRKNRSTEVKDLDETIF